MLWAERVKKSLPTPVNQNHTKNEIPKAEQALAKYANEKNKHNHNQAEISVYHHTDWVYKPIPYLFIRHLSP